VCIIMMQKPGFYSPFRKKKVFFSEDSTWSACLWETKSAFSGDSVFVNGVLYVR
jgi:hypothetical protein